MINTVGSDKEYLVKTYLPCFDSDKIVRYQQLFVSELVDNIAVASGSDQQITRFIHVAHMNLIKGTHYLLEAWKVFNRTDPNAELLLIGSVETNLKKLLHAKGLDQLPNVRFLGFQKDPFAKFRDATAFISPSLSDLGPATILEALSFGIPVITSENCGLSNIVEDGFNGFSYQFNDVEKLSELFSWFVRNKEKMPGMRDNAKKTAQKFSLERYQNEIWSIIKEQL